MPHLKIKSSTVFFIALIFTLVSCHSGYVSLDYKIYPDAYCNNDSSLVAFMITKKAFQKPKGIARFPDGGQSKTIYNKTDLYVFNFKNKTQLNVLHLNDLSLTKGHTLALPIIEISFTDSILFFHISPITGWNNNPKTDHSASDSANIKNIKNLYSKTFVWNFYNQKVWQIDTLEFDSYCSTCTRITLTEAYNFVKKVPLEDIGLNIMDIFPKSKKDYIDETIYLKNDSKISRRAVIEQIIAKLSKNEIRGILLQMDNHLNSLDGFERTSYEFYSKETYEQIQALL
ncbi:MAG: hypothetical protein PHE33_08695 [Bacteroidales bacterium]|nr:hypothetical protein [Bacteroidales bacterium]